MGILLRTRRSQESRWSSEEPRRSSPARMKAELVNPGWGKLQVRSEQEEEGQKKEIEERGRRMKAELVNPGWEVNRGER